MPLIHRRSRLGLGKGICRCGATVASRLDSLGTDVEDEEAELLWFLALPGRNYNDGNCRRFGAARS